MNSPTESIPASDKPRVSLNKLGEYFFSSPSEKLQIIKDQKFGNMPKQTYYGGAMHGILGSFRKESGVFDDATLGAKLAAITSQPADGRNKAAKISNNAEMLKRFGPLRDKARPPAGEHELIYQNARIELGGVVVSVRPEIITRIKGTESIAFTKLRFSKSKVSADASEVILLILIEYGRRMMSPGVTLDIKNTKIVDCFAQVVVSGHELPDIRTKQLATSLDQIARIWPKVQVRSRYSEFF